MKQHQAKILALLFSPLLLSIGNVADAKRVLKGSKSIKQGKSAKSAKSAKSTATCKDTPLLSDNVCDNYVTKGLSFPNVDCADLPQSATNVTDGFDGDLIKTFNGNVAEPETRSYSETDMCAVNVHWHLGTEHISAGEYDENGTGPSEVGERRLAAGKIHEGAQCSLYDETVEKFTKKYDWKYCTNMEVGQTYEVHWPHSKLGACGTQWQYQAPFKTGVFCKIDLDGLSGFLTTQRENLPKYAGVQAQVFTIVNDDSEEYTFPNLFDGMIVDDTKQMGVDMAYYVGSTTGQKVSNTECSPYSPITWQVDRICHQISAKSFDNMCQTMLNQPADMSGDTYPHGSREMVDAANTGIVDGGSI